MCHWNVEPNHLYNCWHVFVSREDIERDIVDARRFTTAAALGTVMGKVFGLRSPHSNALLDRCPTFVSKDKSLKAKLIGKTRKVPDTLVFCMCVCVCVLVQKLKSIQ